MDVDVELDGLPELAARLAHVHRGILELDRELSSELLDATPPTAVFPSPPMRPRTWGAGDVWRLPAGSWLAPRVKLPDGQEELTTHVQQLLNGQ